MHVLQLPNLTPSGPRLCKICGTEAPLYGAIDFNRFYCDASVPPLEPANLLIAYNRCPHCELVFTSAFDAWSVAEFQANIYNEGYDQIDPDYAGKRPEANLTWMEWLFSANKHRLRFLDYGGGNGYLAALMRNAGFTDSQSYDPLVAGQATLPTSVFDVISCFEVLEHLPDPRASIGELCRLAGGTGVILFSTLSQPPDFLEKGVFWRYAAPRNGHISLYSWVTLKEVFGQFGYRVAFFDNNKLIAFAHVPDFVRHLFSNLPELMAPAGNFIDAASLISPVS